MKYRTVWPVYIPNFNANTNILTKKTKNANMIKIEFIIGNNEDVNVNWPAKLPFYYTFAFYILGEEM